MTAPLARLSLPVFGEGGRERQRAAGWGERIWGAVSPHPSRARLSPPREPPSPKSGRDAVAPASQGSASFFRQASIVLAMRFASELFGRCALEKVRGRARRREVQQTRGSSGKNPQVRLLSSVPRAV